MNDLELIRKDPWLEPFRTTIEQRQQKTLVREKELAGGSNLQSFASGHLYFGLHRVNDTWVMREWAPHASEIYLIGTFNDWQVSADFRFDRLEHGNWEIRLKVGVLTHKDRYKLLVRWEGGEGERIPAWCNRVVQDVETKIFDAQAWIPDHSHEVFYGRSHQRTRVVFYNRHIYHYISIEVKFMDLCFF